MTESTKKINSEKINSVIKSAEIRHDKIRAEFDF